MSEYEPGTVALVDRVFENSDEIKANVLVFRWGSPHVDAWVDASGHVTYDTDKPGGLAPHQSAATNVRPLHVLADDEVAVKAEDLRLLHRWAVEHDAAEYREVRFAAHHVGAAINAYDAARTPQIEEPQGLGAVVEDASGDTWTRADRGQLPWFLTLKRGNGGATDWGDWAQINAARVLSEGVRLDEETGR